MTEAERKARRAVLQHEPGFQIETVTSMGAKFQEKTVVCFSITRVGGKSGYVVRGDTDQVLTPDEFWASADPDEDVGDGANYQGIF